MRELVFAYLASRPEFADARTCRKSLVGPMRRYLARHDGRGFEDWEALPPEVVGAAAGLMAERREAGEYLAYVCRRCGRCPEIRILR